LAECHKRDSALATGGMGEIVLVEDGVVLVGVRGDVGIRGGIVTLTQWLRLGRCGSVAG
jgi:hypothetical protein